MSAQRIIFVSIAKNCTVAMSCQVMQISTFSLVFDYQMFKFVDLLSFNLIIPVFPVFLYFIDKVNAHENFTFSCHVS